MSLRTESSQVPSRVPSHAPTARRMATRDRLLEAAADAFSEDGLQGASVEAICSRAGFTRGAFYSNFETKEELFLELLEREFERRAEHLDTQVERFTPELSAKDACFEPADVAHYIGEFFSPESDAATWFVLETEFLLLAMRDPSIAPGYHDLMDRFYAEISGAVEGILAVAGRRFTIAPDQAMHALASVYERELRSAVLSGKDAPDPTGELGERLTAMLFAVTEPLA